MAGGHTEDETMRNFLATVIFLLGCAMLVWAAGTIASDVIGFLSAPGTEPTIFHL